MQGMVQEQLELRFLVVSRHDTICHAIAACLQNILGGTVLEAANAATALSLARGGRFDVVILDEDEGDLCRALRMERNACALLVLCDVDSDMEGADAVLAKPIRLGNIIDTAARLVDNMRRRSGETWVIGPYRFDAGDKRLEDLRESSAIRLTEMETAILARLARARGQTVSRESLLEEVWGYHPEAATHTVETHIYRLRQKIEPDPTFARLILTDPGGYRLVTVQS